MIRNNIFKSYVAVQQNTNNGFTCIVGFSDSVDELIDLIKNRYTFGKRNYQFFVYDTLTVTAQYFIDMSLLHLCQNVGQALELACSFKKNKDKRFIRCSCLDGLLLDSVVLFDNSLKVPFPFDLPAIAVIS